MSRRLLIQDSSDDEETEGADNVRTGVEALIRSDDEAEEGSEEDVNVPEDEEEGEDLLANMEADYKQMRELDEYDRHELDDEEYEAMSQEKLLEAEKSMKKRDREERIRAGRVGRALRSDDELDSDDEEDVQSKRRRSRISLLAENSTAIDMEPVDLDLENFEGCRSLREFLSTPSVEHEIKKRFMNFLKTHGRESGELEIYVSKIVDMCSRNLQSLQVSFDHLSQSEPYLAVYVAEHPKIILPYFNDVASELAVEKFPHYQKIHDLIHVRITHLPAPESLRGLRCIHLNSLIKVSGVVTRRTSVLPVLKLLRFRCMNCEHSMGPYSVTSHSKASATKPPAKCEACQLPTMKFDSEKTVYGNYQKLTLQESPGTVPAGRVPRQKEVVLLDDLIDSARPGEEVEITGVYVSNVDRGLNATNGFPVFSTLFEANFVQKKEDLLSSLRVTEQDKRTLKKLAKDPRIVDRIVRSIAPSIYGNERVKTALALSMFGGREKNIDDKHRVRGDINVLLLGDPGTAKSQCLKYVEKTAPRAVFTTGKGASAVGLTASVHKDPVTREWTLEGGALVLADRGVCLIDEFDKMNDRDRTSIHEAMEQQSISISKAGIVTTLQARCSVVAAANPIGGRYDPQRSFAENVELTDPILQRFDVLCVLQDIVNIADDERLAKFVVSSHVKSHPDSKSENYVQNVFDESAVNQDNQATLIDQETFRKYIIFSKSIKPKLNPSSLDQDKIVDVYVQLRRYSADCGGVPIGVRHAESIIRMAEAFARMHLREFVQMDDFDMAIGVMVNSFIDAQRYSVKRMLKRTFSKFISYKRDNDELLFFLLDEMIREQHDPKDELFQVSCQDFQTRALDVNCERFVNDFFLSERFRGAGFQIQGEGANRVIVKEFVI